jgi:hypothetical protein
VVLDLLVGRDPAHEQEIHQPVVEDRLERRAPGRLGDPRRVDRNRKHAGAAEAECVELLAVVLGIAEREIDAADQRAQLVTAERRQAEQSRVVGREVGRRRYIVVLQDPA